MILDSSAGRARVCGFRVGWQGTRAWLLPPGRLYSHGLLLASARRRISPCNEEQRSQATRKLCNRMRSDLSLWLNAIEAEIFCIHQAFQGTGSGQLRNQG
jgi:hypothetical protein